MGGETRKARVMFTCEHEIKNCLETWAVSENRTVSNLVETLIVDALIAKGVLPEKQLPTSSTKGGGKGKKKKGGDE